MKIDVRKDFLVLIHAVMGIIVALTPFQLFPVCNRLMKNGKPMMCHYSGQLIVGIGVGILVISVLALVYRRKWFRQLAYAGVALAAALSYLIPKRLIPIGDKAVNGWEFGLCKIGNPAMTCQSKMMPALTVMVVIIIAVSVIGLMMNFVKKDIA